MFQEDWNNATREAIDNLLAENVTAHGTGLNGQVHGTGEFKKFYDDFKNQSKDVKVKVEKVGSEDDMESTHCMVNGTDITTGKEAKSDSICVVRIENGKIAEAWNNYDF